MSIENKMRKAVILLDEIDRTRGIVINLIICDEKGVQGLEVPENQIIWDCSQYDVAVGDRWIDGIFYRENKLVEVLLTPEQAAIKQLRENIGLIERTIINMLSGNKAEIYEFLKNSMLKGYANEDNILACTPDYITQEQAQELINIKK